MLSYTLPKEDSNNIWITWHTLEFCWHQHFFIINRQVFLYQEIQMQIAFWYIMSNYCNFSWVFIINMSTISVMSTKMATPGLLNINVFWSKGNDVITSIHDVSDKILSHDSNYVVDVVTWPNFGNSSMREVIITSILHGFDQKSRFLWGVILAHVQ